MKYENLIKSVVEGSGLWNGWFALKGTPNGEKYLEELASSRRSSLCRISEVPNVRTSE